MVVQYKCSNCGADMAFDTESEMLHCSSCGNYQAIDSKRPNEATGSPNYDGQEESNTFNGNLHDETLDEAGKNTVESYNDTQDDDFIIGHTKIFDEDANEYQCNNCGAVLITDKDTTSTKCSFCNAPMILSDRLSGNLAPAKVIPFTINKTEATEAFRAWCRGGLLTPKGFMSADRIKSITGLYVPYWLYDLNGIGEANATCTRTRNYTRGDYIYTETNYFNVYRKVDLNYLKIPADASAKLDDALMDKLEPFDYNSLRSFDLPYLAGYVAEKYNYNSEELFPRIRDRVSSYVDQYINSTISGYTTTTYNFKNINVRNKRADYVLFPVWMVSYDYKEKNYIFAMNGQTGKVVGKPPLSKGKIIAWFTGITTGSFVVLSLLSLIIGDI